MPVVSIRAKLLPFLLKKQAFTDPDTSEVFVLVEHKLVTWCELLQMMADFDIRTGVEWSLPIGADGDSKRIREGLSVLKHEVVWHLEDYKMWSRLFKDRADTHYPVLKTKLDADALWQLKVEEALAKEDD